MSSRKINPFLKSNPDTGFSNQAGQVGGRFINKDGSFNLRKEGMPLFTRVSIYSKLLTLTNGKFFMVLVCFYLIMNLFFTSLFLMAGFDELGGLLQTTQWGKVKEVFFFSTQTFSTVGYGRINPIGDAANLIASIESITALLSFAIVTGLLYGRFTRPRAYIAFSKNALVAPYKNGLALMFRMVPYKINHHLSNASVAVTVSFTIREGDNEEFKFYQLALERSHIDGFTMNWTVVHPFNEESPFLNLSKEDLEHSDVEMYVMVTGFDPVFSNTVMQRTSYTFTEIVWGAKFKPMYHESGDKNTTILELDKLNSWDKVAL